MALCRKDRLNFIYKLTSVIIFAGGIVLLPAISYAQGDGGDLPCGGSDPTSLPCPLDTWVWVLVVIAAIAGSFYINRRQKLQKQA
jgi:hypothetical protein